ncbi:hypothetical protein LX36DRAFT_747266 [Colletotrichum falcatum]|nr:hypothetical protein LX36DRAFT_747266 [Colletotrichum falcatum]
MLLHCLLVFFAAFSSLHSLVSAEVIRPFLRNPAYAAQVRISPDGHTWTFAVMSTGYNRYSKDGSRKPLNFLEIDTVAKSVTVDTAMNGHDTTNGRLKMREVVAECWRLAGLKPAQLREVIGTRISNTDMKAAMKDCRVGMNVGYEDSFSVAATDQDAAKKNCWNRLEKTIFSASIRGAIANLAVGKKVVQVKVVSSLHGDGVHYYFS